MCGIVAIVSTTPVPNRERLGAMCDTLRHRGPDDAGTWWDPQGRVGLAQRRLAIIDLSPSGHQPMADPSGDCWVTFNGEIYNYRELRKQLEDLGCAFRTSSDTEVLLQAYKTWGIDCLSRLNGMFAFVLYDMANRRVLAARDRAGEKPLFFWRRPGSVVFASELKALMNDPAFPRVLNHRSLEFYLTYGYVPDGMCILEDVGKIAAGHAATFDLDRDEWRVFRYWDLPAPPAGTPMSAEEATDELERLLEDAVRRQLVADVPVGVLLSGGLDSSLVTAMAARTSSRPVKTFTIAFPGHGTYDESAYARMVATHFGTDHVELAAEPANVELLPMLARQYDEPIADSSMVPSFLVSRLVRQHCTVALGGDGGDELFGGYPHYSWMQQHERVRGWLPRPVRRMAGELVGRFLPVGVKGRNYAVGFTGDLSESIAHINVYFDRWTRQRLLAPLGGGLSRNGDSPEAFRARQSSPGDSIVRRTTETDFRTTMVDAYLVKVDRASMLNSLELRAPFLDYRLIEFAFGRVPDALRATEHERKILPRRLGAKVLPRELDLRRKQGFSMPLHQWFKGEWGTYIESVLRDADPHLFSRPAIDSLLAGQRRGYANTARLYALTMLELWRREYRIEVA